MVLISILYEFLRLWIELKNGRKTRARVDSDHNIEIEATQLSYRQFLKFLAAIMHSIYFLDDESKEST
jgi:hypothetical protein